MATTFIGEKIKKEKIKKGALHKELGIPSTKKIPEKTINKALDKAKKTHDVKEEKRLVFAKNAKGWKKK